jgi:hypothetical protein
MRSTFINLVVEDAVQHNILIKIILDQNFPFEIGSVYGLKGNSYIKKRLSAFNDASKFNPYLVLTDSDQYDCPKKMISEWIHFEMNPNFIFSIAVREAETWLMADRKNFARFLGVSQSLIPLNPEQVSNPKEFLLNMVLRSKQRRIREEMLSLGKAVRGAGFNDMLSEFIFNQWNVKEASNSSESLARLLRRLQRHTQSLS